jgi:Amt family ammonium transporter
MRLGRQTNGERHVKTFEDTRASLRRPRLPPVAIASTPGAAYAQGAAAPAINQGDTAWMLISTALVLLMTPALAFFYGGLVRSKNALNTMMMSFIALGFVGVAWALAGYSLPSLPATTSWATCRALPAQASGSKRRAPFRTCSSCAYQGTFAIITAALISGAIVERMRFGAYWCSSRSGRSSSTRRSRTGSGAAAGWRRWARSTSRAARSCT